MNIKTFRLANLLLIGVLCTSAALAETVTYFDGGIQRTATVDPQWVAVIAPPASGNISSRSTAASPQALVTLQQANAVSKSADSTLTTVFREGNSPAGRLMTLPGGVIVQLPATWTEAQIQSWLSSKGLTLSQRLNLTGNWLVVATAPGTPAITLANQLQQEGQVLSATPNWWKQTQAR